MYFSGMLTQCKGPVGMAGYCLPHCPPDYSLQEWKEPRYRWLRESVENNGHYHGSHKMFVADI